MCSRNIGFLIAVIAWGLLLIIPGELDAEPLSDPLPKRLQESLQRYCFECHGASKAKKDLRLDQFISLESVLQQRRIWDRVIAHVKEGQMPPEEADVLPDDQQRKLLLSDLEGVLTHVNWDKYRRPGRELIAGLTREEYRNTMKDLLGLDMHPEVNFTIEGEGASGFRNDRKGLSIAAVQVEKYFKAAEAAVEGLLLLSASPNSVKQSFLAEMMERSMPSRMKAHRGGISLANPGQELGLEFVFPVDGYYRVSLRASVMGLPSVARLRMDGDVLAEIPVSSGELTRPIFEGIIFAKKGARRLSIENKNMFPQRRVLPPGAAGLTVAHAEKNHARFRVFKNEGAELKELRQACNRRSAAVQEAYEWLRLLGAEGDSREIDRFRNYAWQREKVLLKARLELAEALGLSAKEIENQWQDENAQRLADNARLLNQVKAVQWADWMKHQGKIFLKRLDLTGPIFLDENGDLVEGNVLKSDQSSLLKLLTQWGRDDDGAIELIRAFLPLAFRRQLSDEEIKRFSDLYRSILEREESSEQAMLYTLTAILSAPEFLFRDECGKLSEGSHAIEALDDFTMASRLSYFLWSSMPDEELFRLALSGDLQNEQVLQQQVDRILVDKKAKVFYRSFTDQWLGIASLGVSVSPDAQRFPEFTPDLADMMKEETVKFIELVFVENLALTDLLDSDWTFLNQRLAQHYGIEGVRSADLGKVKIDDPRRGGLLGMGSVLTVTSSPTRTNPMRRGFWVLEGILGDRLGEPPGDAGELPGGAGETRGKSLREEIELHRTQKSCMSCHVKLDPIGFGLQNFDALGRWRDEEAGSPVDSSGVMPDGRRFNGPVELKQVLLEHKDEFVKNLCSRMLSYALGRKLEYYDEAELQRIFELVKNDGYRAQTLLRAVGSCYPFRFRDVEK